jgi:hypothetical protein
VSILPQLLALTCPFGQAGQKGLPPVHLNSESGC